MAGPVSAQDGGPVSGTQQTWHRTTLTFDGPDVSETDGEADSEPNPF
jgi:hypothetical protein